MTIKNKLYKRRQPVRWVTPGPPGSSISMEPGKRYNRSIQTSSAPAMNQERNAPAPEKRLTFHPLHLGMGLPRRAPVCWGPHGFGNRLPPAAAHVVLAAARGECSLKSKPNKMQKRARWSMRAPHRLPPPIADAAPGPC